MFLSRGHCSQQFNCCELIWQQAGMMTWENVRCEDNIVGYQLHYSELTYVFRGSCIIQSWQKSDFFVVVFVEMHGCML